MKMSKIALAMSLTAGTMAAASSVSAVQIAAGNYDMTVAITPTTYVGYPVYATINVIGNDGAGTDGNGAYNSSFSFGTLPKGTSQGMTDGTATVNGVSVGVVDSAAGHVGLSVDGAGNISVTSFQMDPIFGTAGGTFAQYADGAGMATMGGTTTASTTTLDLTGRQGAVSNFEVMVDLPWDYALFSTASSTNPVGTVHGTAVQNVGDVNFDGIDDYTATFVSAGIVGVEWGDFNPTPYIEVWKVAINSSPVPVPAAVWLFGSGLVGLAGIARRRKA